MPDSETFIQTYVETGNVMASLQEGGYKPNRNTGYALRKKHQEEIEKRMQDRLRQTGPKALAVVEGLMDHAMSETVRLSAAKDVLDRAGYKAYDENAIGRNIEEMNEQLIALVGKDGAKLLVHSMRTRKQISGPEITGD
tara:strand:- start:113 stop:529 length:417 start_codon:yes stop_codon:yes gene_type:complete